MTVAHVVVDDPNSVVNGSHVLTGIATGGVGHVVSGPDDEILTYTLKIIYNDQESAGTLSINFPGSQTISPTSASLTHNGSFVFSGLSAGVAYSWTVLAADDTMRGEVVSSPTPVNINITHPVAPGVEFDMDGSAAHTGTISDEAEFTILSKS